MRGPSGGYDFPAKSQYRDQVWSAILRSIPNPLTARVAFLPGTEGLEIPLALAMGFKQENLHAIEGDASLVMRKELKWRELYPMVNFHYGKTSKVIDRLRARGVKLDAANFDYCGQLSGEMVDELSAIGASNSFAATAPIAITALRGREGRETTGVMRLLSRYAPRCFDDPRFYGITQAMFPEINVEIIDQGKYNSSVPMGWIVFRKIGFATSGGATCVVCNSLFQTKDADHPSATCSGSCISAYRSISNSAGAYVGRRYGWKLPREEFSRRKAAEMQSRFRERNQKGREIV